MKTNQYRSHSIAAALAATFVTTVLVSSLVESFEPAQLLQIEGEAAPRSRHRPGPPPDERGRLDLTHARSQRPAAHGRAPIFPRRAR